MPNLLLRAFNMTNPRLTLKLIILVFITSSFCIPSLCFSQDSVNTEKILVAQKTIKPKLQIHPTPYNIHHYFKKGNRVSIKKFDNTKVNGKIDSIADSSIVIKGDLIKLNDIKRLNRKWGLNALATIAVFAGAYTAIGYIYPPKYDEVDFNVNAYGYNMSIYITTICAGVVGIIEIVSIKYYKMDKNSKLYVMTKIKKK